MNTSIAIIEDDTNARSALVGLCREFAENTGFPGISIAGYPSAEAFLFENGDSNPHDVLLLDVELGKMSGIELAKHIRRFDRRAELIFITSHTEFIGEGYEVDALHYLIKPVKPEKLEALLRRAIDRLAAEPPSLIVSSDGELMKLCEDEILFIEAFSHRVTIHTSSGELVVNESISAIEKRLSSGFFRLHRSYIASLKHIVRISRREVTLDSGDKLPLARGLYDAINLAFIENN